MRQNDLLLRVPALRVLVRVHSLAALVVRVVPLSHPALLALAVLQVLPVLPAFPLVQVHSALVVQVVAQAPPSVVLPQVALLQVAVLLAVLLQAVVLRSVVHPVHQVVLRSAAVVLHSVLLALPVLQ